MGLEPVSTAAAAAVDFDRFRLRRFVEELAATGELETRTGTTRLADIARTLEANPKAVLFETVGRDGFPLIGNALGSRKRFAQAFGTSPHKLLPEILARLRGKAEFVEVGRDQAPVQEIV
jgi:2,5-furandicarboxylate decarboxylase 1